MNSYLPDGFQYGIFIDLFDDVIFSNGSMLLVSVGAAPDLTILTDYSHFFHKSP